jgi:uracil-DNA glycosylase
MQQVKFIDEKYDWKNTSLIQYLIEGNIPFYWRDFFTLTDIEEELVKISQYLSSICNERVIFPPPNLVFRAFSLGLTDIRVIILGQDCYHDGNAVGLCFSVKHGAKINPSLNNIYTELDQEGYPQKRSGDLEHWVKQGCLLINTALTVEKGTPLSHVGIWKNFSHNLLEYISDRTKNVAWLLLGKQAESFKFLTEKNGHRAFITSHPSPLSAQRKLGNYPAFMGSGVFNEINNFLDKKISW